MIKITEKNVPLALLKAAGQLGTTQDRVSHRVVEEKNGFLGLFGRQVTIEAWMVNKRQGGESNRGHKNQRRDSKHVKTASKKPNVVFEPRKLSAEECIVVCEQLQEKCGALVSQILGRRLKVTYLMQTERLCLDVVDQEFATMIEENAKLGEAIEHLIRKGPRSSGLQDLPFRIFVDACGTRRAREDELIEMAKGLSQQVSDDQKPVVLNYRSSYDRKIIHMALDKDDKVYTKSIGAGANRKLMILPSRGDTLELNA